MSKQESFSFEDPIPQETLTKIKNTPIQVLYSEFTSEGPSDAVKSAISCCLQNEPTPKTAALMGWFSLRSYITPEQTASFLDLLLQSAEKSKSLNVCKTFIRSILPIITQYTDFVQKVLNIDHIEVYDPLFYISVKELIGNKAELTNVDSSDIAITSLDSYPISMQPPSAPLPPPPEPSTEPLAGQNILKVLETSITMPKMKFYALILQACLECEPPNVEVPEWLIRELCQLVKMELSSLRGKHYELIGPNDLLKRLGFWLAALTVRRGNPIRIQDLSLIRLITDSVQTGTTAQVISFLTGFLQDIHESLKPPSPYTISILELLRAIQKVENLRYDIYLLLKTFEKVTGFELHQFDRRSIIFPESTFDKASVFIEGEGLTQPDNTKGKSPIQNYEFQFFNYDFNPDSLPPPLPSIINTGKKKQRYYFDGKSTFVPSKALTSNHFNGLLSMSFLNNSFINSFASEALTETYKVHFDAIKLFRLHFPNPSILKACLKMDCVSKNELIEYFYDVLLNPRLHEQAFKLLGPLLAIIYDYFPEPEFKILEEVCCTTATSLTKPTVSLTSLVTSFKKYEETRDDTDFMAFRTMLSPPTVSQMLDLIFYALCDSNKERAKFLANALIKCRRDINEFQLFTSTISVISDYSALLLANSPTAVHAFLSEFLQNAPNHKDVIQLLEKLSPQECPRFCALWVDLCLSLLHSILRQYTPCTVQFALKFIITLVKLAEMNYDGFYKPVLKAFYIIASENPSFFMLYHFIITSTIPFNYTQLRNIVLNAFPEKPRSYQPTFPEIQQFKALKIIIDPYFKMSKTPTTSNAQLISKILIKENDRLLLCQFVAYIVYNFSIVDASQTTKYPIVEFLSSLMTCVNDELRTYLLVAFIDHLRHHSDHTTLVQNLLHALFSISEPHLREAIFVELVRPLLCVEPAPIEVFDLFRRIANDYKAELDTMFKHNGEWPYYNQVLCVIESNYGSLSD